MIGFMLNMSTKIERLNKKYLKYENKHEILILRNDKTPIFLIKEIKENVLKFYELDSITEEERTIINRYFESVLMNVCDEITGFIALAAEFNMIDYSKIFDITKFKDGELMVA